MKVTASFVLFSILVGLLSGCVTQYRPGTEHTPQMSLAEANTVIRTFKYQNPYPNLSHTTKSIEIRQNSLRAVRENGTLSECFYGKLIPEVDIRSWVTLTLYECNGEDKTIGFHGLSESRARRLADAFYVLKQDYLVRHAPETPQQQATFDAVVKQYRATQPLPALPEGALRFKAQAEFAVQQKRFDDAVDLYGEALKVAPWWPQGYYNRGLLLGELEGYTEAIRDLQKYLKLEPNAPNAQAVQTKIYQWEGKTSATR